MTACESKRKVLAVASKMSKTGLNLAINSKLDERARLVQKGLATLEVDQELTHMAEIWLKKP